MSLRLTVIAGLLIGSLCAWPALADQEADFYQGRTVSLVVGFNPGGGYDAYGRLIARHLGRHIPGSPAIVVRNMQGARRLGFTIRPVNAAEIASFLQDAYQTPPPLAERVRVLLGRN